MKSVQEKWLSYKESLCHRKKLLFFLVSNLKPPRPFDSWPHYPPAGHKTCLISPCGHIWDLLSPKQRVTLGPAQHFCWAGGIIGLPTLTMGLMETFCQNLWFPDLGHSDSSLPLFLWIPNTLVKHSVVQEVLDADTARTIPYPLVSLVNKFHLCRYISQGPFQQQQTIPWQDTFEKGRPHSRNFHYRVLL